MSHTGSIAPWAVVSAVNPNDGIRYGYITRNRSHPSCNPSNGWSGCVFLLDINFDPGQTFDPLNGQLQVGQFVSIYYPAPQSVQCVEILKIIDEAEYNSGLGIMNCPSNFSNSHGTFTPCPCNVIYGDLDAGHWAGSAPASIFYDCNSCTISTPNTDISGCTDALATNYNPTATVDDGSCIYKWKCDLTANPVCFIDPLGIYNNQNDCMLSCTTVNKCDCLTIAGTGHTGPTPGYFAFPHTPIVLTLVVRI